jgi:hypothetical protein
MFLINGIVQNAVKIITTLATDKPGIKSVSYATNYKFCEIHLIWQSSSQMIHQDTITNLAIAA